MIMKIKAIYDNGGATADRYTVITDEKSTVQGIFTGNILTPWSKPSPSYLAFTFSDDCNMPNGVNMIVNIIPGSHLGKKIKFSQLPKRVQACVEARLGGD